MVAGFLIGPPGLQEERMRPGRRCQSHPNTHAPLQNPDETVLGALLQSCQDQTEITVTNANATLPHQLGFRSDHVAICPLFGLAVQHQAGVREGATHQSLRWHLMLHGVDSTFRQHLNLQLAAPSSKREAAVARTPLMAGVGKRPRKKVAEEVVPAVGEPQTSVDEDVEESNKRPKLERESWLLLSICL